MIILINESRYDDEMPNTKAAVWIKLYTDGTNLYGLNNYLDMIKSVDYDSYECEDYIEYSFGDYEDYDTDYIDALVKESEEAFTPYIKRLFEDIKKGKYPGFWCFVLKYSVDGWFESDGWSDPEYRGYYSITPTLMWEDGSGTVSTEDTIKITEKEFISKVEENPAFEIIYGSLQY